MRAMKVRAGAALVCSLLLAPLAAMATVVRMNTDRGPIDIVLYDTQAPLTVTNFLNYVRRNAFDNSFFHRHEPGFVLQGGGYTTPPLTKIPTDPAVPNEFNAARSNLRGTVAMAKLGGLANSATSEWFINLGDNSANLDNQNGGFTVFGRVTTPSMAVVDATTLLTTVNAAGCQASYSAFSRVPVTGTVTTCAQFTDAIANRGLAMVTSARELPTTTATDADRAFNYIEAAYPQYAAPASSASVSQPDGYYYRFYAKTGAYLGAKDGQLFYLVPSLSPQIQPLGSLADWVGAAKAAGY